MGDDRAPPGPLPVSEVQGGFLTGGPKNQWEHSFQDSRSPQKSEQLCPLLPGPQVGAHTKKDTTF